MLANAFTKTEQLHHFDINESLLDELNALIEEFGKTALVVDFVQNAASEALSRVIDAAMKDRDQESPPTLEAIKETIISGLQASLVGASVLEEDEDDVLLAEIEALINKHGADSLAEEFLRYEIIIYLYSFYYKTVHSAKMNLNKDSKSNDSYILKILFIFTALCIWIKFTHCKPVLVLKFQP